ncbi:MAG TPA: condensation domain-containing protein, partial [Longimicrobiaceae bacterium]
GALDASAMERALGEVVRRHDVLRTTFPEVDGAPVQVIAPFSGFTLPVEDLTALGEEEREEAVRRRVAEDAARPFDLARGPVFRPALLRLAGDSHVLLLTMHHIVGDGWSGNVLQRELWTLYEAYRDGREPELPGLPVQYADYAVWQRRQAADERQERHLAWWKAHLAGAPAVLELPTDHPRPPLPSLRGGSVATYVRPEVLEGLRALARGEGATLYMTVLAAFQVLLGRYAASDDFVVGTLAAGRTRREVEGVIGPFVNTLALRADLSGDPPFAEVVRRAREATLAAYERQEVPFEKLVEELQPERSLSHTPLFQVTFSLDTVEGPRRERAGLRSEGVGAGDATTKFDLTLAAFESSRGLLAVLHYSRDLFEPDTARRMLGHFERVLEEGPARPTVPISRLELPGPAERALVLGEWNRSDAAYPADRCLHQLFAEQAARTPDAVALVCGETSLGYRALDERANRLARRLRERGVGPEVRVGLCVERTPDLLVGVLGIWKAGGAWVALDPEYPAERLGW